MSKYLKRIILTSTIFWLPYFAGEAAQTNDQNKNVTSYFTELHVFTSAEVVEHSKIKPHDNVKTVTHQRRCKVINCNITEEMKLILNGHCNINNIRS